jgi:hypothetical protein
MTITAITSIATAISERSMAAEIATATSAPTTEPGIAPSARPMVGRVCSRFVRANGTVAPGDKQKKPSMFVAIAVVGDIPTSNMVGTVTSDVPSGDGA